MTDKPWPGNVATPDLEQLESKLDLALTLLDGLPVRDQKLRVRQLSQAAEAVRAELQSRRAREALQAAILALRHTGCPSVRGGVS